jgi:hypothetical protein
VFLESFLPAARRLPTATDKWDGGNDATMWQKRSSADRGFDIPTDLANAAGHPNKVARAMLSQWQPGPVAEALESVLVDLLTVRRDHLPLPDVGDEVAATVPGSAYVMY